jgi:hypothetical protein
VSHGPDLQGRHLAQRSEGRGGHHQHDPAEQPQPEPPDVIVRGELRRETVERVGETGGERHEHAAAARCASQPQRQQRDRCEPAEREPQRHSLAVDGVTGGSREREQRHPGRDGARRERLATPHVLVQPAGREREQEDQARPQQGLDERQGRLRQRVALHHPAHETERRPNQPARTADEAGEQREAKGPLGGRLARLERLQGDSRRVDRSGAECRQDPGQERRHDRTGP